MSIPSDEQIQAWRARWIGKEQLIDQLIAILKGDGKVKTAQGAERRLNEANDLLTANGFPPVKEKVEIWLIDDEITIPALDLRGIDLFHKKYEEICLLGAHLEGVDFRHAHLERADLDSAHLKGVNLRNAHLEGAYLDGAHLEGADLYSAHLKGVNLRNAHLEGAYLSNAHLEAADLVYAHLEGIDLRYAHLEGAVFYGAYFGKLTIDTFNSDCQLSKEEKNELITERNMTVFYANDFLPRWRDHFFHKSGRKYTRLKKRPSWKNLFCHLFNRWNYTNFYGVRIDDADTTMSADLYRYVKDQQFLSRFRQRHPVIYWIWKIFSDCGGRLSWVGIWAFIFVFAFAKIYQTIPWGCAPTWMEKVPILKWFVYEIPPLNLELFTNFKETLPEFWKYLFVSFDIFSNLGIRTMTPQSELGVILILTESVLGFMMLGMLISVLANRFARRS